MANRTPPSSDAPLTPQQKFELRQRTHQALQQAREIQKLDKSERARDPKKPAAPNSASAPKTNNNQTTGKKHKAEKSGRSFAPAAIARIAGILAISDQDAENFCIRMRSSTNNPGLPIERIEWALIKYPRLRSNPEELAKLLPRTTVTRPPVAGSPKQLPAPQPKPKNKPSKKKRVPQKTGNTPKGIYSYDFYFDAPPDPGELPNKHYVSGGLPGSGKRS